MLEMVFIGVKISDLIFGLGEKFRPYLRMGEVSAADQHWILPMPSREGEYLGAREIQCESKVRGDRCDPLMSFGGVKEQTSGL